MIPSPILGAILGEGSHAISTSRVRLFTLANSSLLALCTRS